MSKKIKVSRKADFNKLQSHAQMRESYIIRIATEGQNTEFRYFTQCISIPKNLQNRIKIEVLPTTDGRSAPEHVLERILESVQKINCQGNHDLADQYWIVVDVDQHKNLNDTLEKIEEKGELKDWNIQPAVSSPCFEVWLAMYKPDIAPETLNNNASIIKAVKEVDDHYTKQGFNSKRFQNHALAIQQAEKIDFNKSGAIPAAPGTRVYRLVKEILNVIEQEKQAHR